MVSLPKEFGLQVKTENKDSTKDNTRLTTQAKYSDLYYSNLFGGSITEEDEAINSSFEHDNEMMRKRATFDWSPGVSFQPMSCDTKDNYTSNFMEDDVIRKTEQEI